MSAKQGFRKPSREADQVSKGLNASSKEDGTFSTQRTATENNLGTDTSNARPQTTPWELYNERAHIYDRETLKEWEDNLSILLVFTALFSGILTAFIVSSLPLVTEDKQDVMKNILLVISRQLQNASTPAYHPVIFEPTQWSINVNILFFTSLGCNLFAALSSVLALQWVRDYDVGLSGITDPRERALRRHFRLQGVQTWLMPEIISLLPTLLHIALLVFVCGLLEWLRQINRSIAYTMLATLVVSVLFYLGTQFIAAASPSAPYRTPISRSLEATWRFILSTRKFIDTKIKQSVSGYYGLRRPIPVNKHTLGRHSREVKAVQSSPPLPSSALFWLLNHVDHSDRSVQILLDICHYLLHEEGASVVSQMNAQDLVHWSTIIDTITLSLGKTRKEDFTYHSEIEKHFSTIFCLLAMFRGKSMRLQPSTWHILNREPFSQVYYQSTPLGLTSRFALWRNEKGFSLDTSGPPVDLFQDICKLYGRVPDMVIVILLREIRALLKAETITREVGSACLVSLLNSPDPTNGIAYIFSHKPLVNEILLTASLLLGSPLPEANGTDSVLGVSQGVAKLLGAYTTLRASNVSPSTEFDKLVFSFLPQVLYDLALDQDSSTIPDKLRLFRHPTISSIWTDPNYRMQFNRSSGIVQDYFWGQARTLYPARSKETLVWAVELTHSILLLLTRYSGSLHPGDEDWRTVIACLETLGCCISGERYNERWTIETSIGDPALWVTQLLKHLAPGFKDETFAFLISAMLTGPVRKLFARNLHCVASVERMDRLREISNPVLCILGCLLLGWEFAEYIPAYNDPVWDTSAMKILVDFKNGFGPYMLYASDAPLYLEITRRDDTFLQRKVFWFLIKHSKVLVFVGQTDAHSRKATAREPLTIGMPVFINLPAYQCQATHLILRWSALDGFLPSFIELGGLKWLWTIRSPCPENCRECTYFKSPVSGFVTCMGGRNGFPNALNPQGLSEEQTVRILRTPLRRASVGDEDVHEYIVAVKTLYLHLQGLGNRDTFPEVANQCARMMTEESRVQKYWERTRVQFGAGNFEDWREEVTAFIKDLNGGGLPNILVDSTNMGKDDASQNVPSFGEQNEHIEPYM
ncbi:hypothetical protein CPB86DRAFT_757098 [Serendipita vermifera]|nr:hypothetical protein CPB86DRAFT_757098 [Serendipita vermifera]